MPYREVTLKDVAWRTNSPTDTTCSFLYAGCEHFFEKRLSFRHYAFKVRSVSVTDRAGLYCLPRAQFEQMRRLALWIMQASEERKLRVRRDIERNILRPLEDYEKSSKEFERVLQPSFL